MRQLAVAVLLAIFVAACGRGSVSPSDARTVEIEMRDFAYFPETLTLRAGEKVTLRFKNISKLEHEFMAGSDPMIGVGYMKDWLAGTGLATDGEHDMNHHSGTATNKNARRTVS